MSLLWHYQATCHEIALRVPVTLTLNIDPEVHRFFRTGSAGCEDVKYVENVFYKSFTENIMQFLILNIILYCSGNFMA